MTSKPMAIGTEIVAIFASASQFTNDGAILPRMRPIAIAAAIHSGKKRSRKLSDFVVCVIVSGVINISMIVNIFRGGRVASTGMDEISECCALGGRPLDTAEAQAAATLFKALAQPARLQILSQLAAAGCSPMTVGELAAVSGLSQPTVSHHLKTMADAGLLTRSKSGRVVTHEVRPEVFAELRRILDIGHANGS